MSVVDKIARKVALRWLRAKVHKAREGGSGMLKALDGWKSFIVTIGFIGASMVSLTTGHAVGELLQPVLQALGWADPAALARARGFATTVAPLLFALWAAASRLRKAVVQYKAGAALGDLLGVQGYVEQAWAEKILPRTTR